MIKVKSFSGRDLTVICEEMQNFLNNKVYVSHSHAIGADYQYTIVLVYKLP